MDNSSQGQYQQKMQENGGPYKKRRQLQPSTRYLNEQKPTSRPKNGDRSTQSIRIRIKTPKVLSGSKQKSNRFYTLQNEPTESSLKNRHGEFESKIKLFDEFDYLQKLKKLQWQIQNIHGGPLNLENYEMKQRNASDIKNQIKLRQTMKQSSCRIVSRLIRKKCVNVVDFTFKQLKNENLLFLIQENSKKRRQLADTD